MSTNRLSLKRWLSGESEQAGSMTGPFFHSTPQSLHLHEQEIGENLEKMKQNIKSVEKNKSSELDT